MTLKTHKEEGFVSILTVLFFMILITVIVVSFTRIMVQERRQTLEDELTKSAYNSAMSGVADAKRAMLYCESLSGTDRTNCEAELYNATCPGFNAMSGGYIAASGVVPSQNNKTPLVGTDAQASSQGYSCVLVSKLSQNLQAHVTQSRSAGVMYEMKTSTPYQSLLVSWHKASSAPTVPSQGTFVSVGSPNKGNPRDDGYMTNIPAVLRVTVITLDASGTFNLNDATSRQVTTFLYPSDTFTLATMNDVDVSAPAKRLETHCGLAAYGEYSCAAKITYQAPRSANSFVLVHALYSDTDISIAAYDSLGVAAVFDNVQPTIDSTGYASGIFRRVKVGVSAGGSALNTADAIDSGLGLCKDFRVGASDAVFMNTTRSTCQP